MQYLVVIERGPTSVGAYVPDLPGCVAVAESQAEVEILIREAIEFHIEGLRDEGRPLPEPTSTSQFVTIDAYHAAGADAAQRQRYAGMNSRTT